ncbi:hypothetical protein EES39_37315 [Streptomyces sp. ADI92-24]|nr:hypothetical protein EES39_37315 [Streptomyces sp. ADI92-24]
MRGRRALGVPGAEEVVRHRVVPVDVLRCAAVVDGVELAALGAVRADRRGDQVVCAELRAEGGQQVAVGVTAAGVTGQTAGVGVLPVDVDAVEDIGPTRVLHQAVAGVGERGRVLRGLTEAAGPGPAAERPEDLEVGVQLLQLAELVEAAAQLLVPGVGHPVDRLVGRVGLLVVGIGVTDRALAALDVAEGVVDVRELVGRARGLDVLDVVIALVDTPVGEVADHLAAGRCGGGGRCRRGGGLQVGGGRAGGSGARDAQQGGAQGGGTGGSGERPEAGSRAMQSDHRCSSWGRDLPVDDRLSALAQSWHEREKSVRREP